MLKLTVNGEPHEAPEGSTVRQLVERLGLAGRAVAVEVNKRLVPKREHETHQLQDGNAVEVVTLVGGG
jgi:sulfur carrier protein